MLIKGDENMENKNRYEKGKKGSFGWPLGWFREVKMEISPFNIQQQEN